MRQIKFFLALLILSQSTIFSQNGWFQQNSGTNKYITSCYFLNDNTGYVTCMGGLILKTTNGGANWLTVYNYSIYDMKSIHFLNTSTGWVHGNYLDYENPDTNIVLKTTNGGQFWTKTIVDTIGFGPFGDIQFLNSLTGYLAWSNLKKTTNGGLNWFVVFNQNSNGVFFINNFTGWTGGFGNGISKTTNEGLTWEQQVTPTPHQYKTDIYFLNENTGYYTAGSPYGWLYRTTNSGVNWESPGLPYDKSSITFVNQNTGFFLAINNLNYPPYYIAKTTNSGLNWIFHNINTSRYLSKIFFSSVNTGWAVGDSGTILKTTTGGVTIGINPISTEIPVDFSLSQNFPNPFNPSTKIRFDISGRSVAQTFLSVYDILGREVTVLANELLKPGTYEVNFDGSDYPSGVYYYKLQAGDFSETRKMVLVK